MARPAIYSPCKMLLCVTSLVAVLSNVLGRHVHTLKPDKATVPLSMAALSAAATPEAAAQQTALRKAISNFNYKVPVNFTLTTDIVLTAPLADGVPVNALIIGKCKHRDGRARSCIIDGAGKYTVFSGDYVCYISLERLIIQNAYGAHRDCSLSARYVIFRNNVGEKGAVVDSSEYFWDRPFKFFRCDFINNTALSGDGGVINIDSYTDPSGPILSFTNCTFRNNHALHGRGGAIYGKESAMMFRNVVFEGNSAVSGGAIVTSMTTFTAINTTFAANTATNGHGGAIVFSLELSDATFKFCHSTFRSNIANPSRYRASNNILFVTGSIRASVDFCPGPVPGGVQAPKIIKLIQNCRGCSGCDGDCYGHGLCVLDPLFAFPSCRCNTFSTSESSCTYCQLGYSHDSQCTQCSGAYYHPKSKPATCVLCPGFSKILEPTWEDIGIFSGIYNVTAATGPLQCQQFCNVSMQPSSPYFP